MDGHSRRRFLGAGAAVALVGPAVLQNFAEAAVSADPADLETLNAAIALESAGIKAYQDAAATKLLVPAVLTIALGFMADHIAHRDALSIAVRAGGGTPTTEIAKLDYPKLVKQEDVLRFAMAIEEQAASTYLSVVPDLRNRKLAQTAAAILGVETTHVALLGQALGVSRVYPKSFVV